MIRENSVYGLRGRQGGQAIAEYVYTFPILILLIFGAIQFAFVFQAKATLNQAVFVAARSGALNSGSMMSIQESLASGMAPLFTHGRDLGALKAAYSFAEGEVNNPKLTTIWIVNPPQATFNVLSTARENDVAGEIPNDNLMYRDTGVINADRKMNIQDANLLKVRVRYCFRMVVPFINRLIYELSVDRPDAVQPIPCTDVPDEEFRIPLTAESVIRMQTPFKHPGGWVGPLKGT